MQPFLADWFGGHALGTLVIVVVLCWLSIERKLDAILRAVRGLPTEKEERESAKMGIFPPPE